MSCMIMEGLYESKLRECLERACRSVDGETDDETRMMGKMTTAGTKANEETEAKEKPCDA